MATAFELRPMRVPQDCAGVADVRSQCFPDWPVAAAQVAEGETRRVADRLHIAWVAAADKEIAGYGYIEEPGVAARPGRVRIRVLVPPGWQGQGVGRGLYTALERVAADQGADELVTEAQAGDPRARRFLADRGFVEYHHRLESRLPLAGVDPAAVARSIDACADAFFATGVRVATYRQLLLAFPDASRRLYELDAELWADVPFGLTGAVPTFEQYADLELADPDFLPPATFVALDGERWIGLCALTRGPGFLLNSMTGVRRRWRGRGLARWMKLHSIRYALECGAAEIRTFNDGVNEAILNLNRSLGFSVVATELRYRKDVR